MSFSSPRFVIFFIVIYVILWINRGFSSILKGINQEIVSQRIILLASYLFLYLIDYRFCFCLFFITCLTYFTAVKIDQNRKEHKYYKKYLVIGIAISLGMLGVFKYFNFFVSSLCEWIGKDYVSIHFILPVGISFYVFSAISYIIDIYRNKYSVSENFWDIALWMSFFPKIISGPIIRADEFLPQLKQERGVNLKNFETGIQIFVFGIFKKVVLADHLNVFVNDVFRAPMAFHSIACILAAVSYSLQIYFDFSGYSDMAIGIAKLLGFDFSRNFNLPYMSKNLTEFWKRWHISLSEWLQEYLYYPLGGGRKGAFRRYLNLFLTMLLGGLWHGASWTFVIWGSLHGISLIVHKVFVKWKNSYFKKKDVQNKLWNFISCVFTFCFVTFCWVFFRADTFSNAIMMLSRIFLWKNGIVQIYSWLLFAIIILVISYFAAVFNSKKQNKKSYDGNYLKLDLTKTLDLVIFFVICGITLCMGCYGNTFFIYGSF